MAKTTARKSTPSKGPAAVGTKKTPKAKGPAAASPAGRSSAASGSKKVELKTRPTGASVDAFIDAVADAERRSDCRTLIEIMGKATRAAPEMWGTSIVGFGTVQLKYASGRELDWPVIGFSPRKGDLSLYLHSAFPTRTEMLSRFGKHKTGVSCIYVRRLADIDLKVLKEMVKASVTWSARNPSC